MMSMILKRRLTLKMTVPNDPRLLKQATEFVYGKRHSKAIATMALT
jgi:hypothetical protein